MSQTTKSKYGKDFLTPIVEVFWSNLSTPDIKFGNPNHSVTVVMTPELNLMVMDALKTLGGKKINALREHEGKKIIKFKNTLFAKGGGIQFPVMGPDLKPSTIIPFRPDTVRVVVSPILIERDNSVSFYMKEIQLVSRNYVGNTVTFQDEVIPTT